MKLPIYTVIDRDGGEHTFDEELDDCSYYFRYGGKNENNGEDVLYVTRSGSGPAEVARYFCPREMRTTWHDVMRATE